MDIESKNMKANWKNGVCFLTFPAFESIPFVRHAFSTRIGGVSQNEFSSMNLSFGRGDPKENVQENYRRFCEAVGFEQDSLVSSAQVHGKVIRRVGRESRGEGFTRPKAETGVDGLVTNEPGVTLVTHYADCVPLFFADPKHRAVGLAHSGWCGTAQKVGRAVVEKMTLEFGSRPEELLVAVGPSIGPCCFEVDSPVRDVFATMTELRPNEWIREDGGEKYHIDLWEANRRILMEAGIPEHSISVAGLCTKCSADWLYSHRASGGKRGGLAGFLELSEED